MTGEQWYVHFHPDEHRFVDQVSDWVERAQNHSVKLTDFLDPRQAFIVASVAQRSSDVHVRLEGGSSDAERKRALIAPDYRDLEQEDMNLSVLSISSPDDRLSQLDHGDYMGSVLGLGITRGKVGDIHVRTDGCHIVVASEIADFLRLHLSQVHRLHVFTEVLPVAELVPAVTKLTEQSYSVASMRLDGIVGDVWKLSRAKSLVPIKAGRCRVNWKQEEDPSRHLKSGDVVSLQGFGRFQVLEVEGVTKSGRTRIKIGKYE